SGVPPGSVFVRMWHGLSRPARADKRPRWIVASQPAVRADLPAPPTVAPALLRLAASARGRDVAADIRLKGSRSADRLLSGARGAERHSPGLCVGLLCGLGVPAGANSLHARAARHRPSTRDG